MHNKCQMDKIPETAIHDIGTMAPISKTKHVQNPAPLTKNEKNSGL